MVFLDFDGQPFCGIGVRGFSPDDRSIAQRQQPARGGDLFWKRQEEADEAAQLKILVHADENPTRA